MMIMIKQTDKSLFVKVQKRILICNIEQMIKYLFVKIQNTYL